MPALDPSAISVPSSRPNTLRFVRFLVCVPFVAMVLLVFVEAALQATVTYLVIQAGKDIATSDFKVSDFLWIVVAQTGLLGDNTAREQVEPFLTNETFHLLFELMYELEGALQLFFGLLLSALVIGYEIDAGFPLAYALIFVLVMSLQYLLRKPVANAYL